MCSNCEMSEMLSTSMGLITDTSAENFRRMMVLGAEVSLYALIHPACPVDILRERMGYAAHENPTDEDQCARWQAMSGSEQDYETWQNRVQ